MGRRLVLVGLFVLFERGSIRQVFVGSMFSIVYLLMQVQAEPYDLLADDYLANGCSFLLVVLFVCCIVFKVGTLTELDRVQAVLSNEQNDDFASSTTTLLVVLVCCVLGAVAMSVVILLAQLAKEQERLRSERRLPTTTWTLARENNYVCFLSHYKVEAGADARYLKDALESMLDVPVYLEYRAIARTRDERCVVLMLVLRSSPRVGSSSNLADLRKLFKRGVDASEVLVLLLTEGLLTRPWYAHIASAHAPNSYCACVHANVPPHGSSATALPPPSPRAPKRCLLEVREAMMHRKPIVLLEIKNKRFSFDDAFALLEDLEATLPAYNKDAVDELRAHLPAGETLQDLQQLVTEALEKGRALAPVTGSRKVVELNLNGTSNQLEAEVRDGKAGAPCGLALVSGVRGRLSWCCAAD
jgi:hypothetical protein